jgi:hypothetical protein
MEAMSVAWIPAASLLVFLATFVLYVLASRPARNEHGLAGAHPSRAIYLPALAQAPCNVSLEYRVTMSAPTFVNYPLGVRILFGDIARGSPNRDQSPHACRMLEESDSHAWPLGGKNDAQPQVGSGKIDFDEEEGEPRLGVELLYDNSAFEPLRTQAMVNLGQSPGVVCSLWLNPLKEGESLLTLVIGRQGQSIGSDTSNAGSQALVTVSLLVKVTEFPIRLR